MKLPEAFCQTTLKEWGSAEAEALFAALDSDSPTAIRLHPMRGEKPAGATPIPWSEGGWYLDERPSFTLDPAFHAGAYYVQEASSQFVGCLLQGEPIRGARLLDMCAAPGGKTTLYASLVGAEGLVVANEVDRRRLQTLQDNVRKWGLGNVVVTTAEASRFEPLEGWFDVVAVDAPCSGEGMFRRLKPSREEWSEQSVLRCSALQHEILESAWQALKPGGLLLYSTCTFNRTEDEGVVADFAAAHAEELEAVEPIVGAESWGVVAGRVAAFCTYRFFPHRAQGEGFFVAVARKRSDCPCDVWRIKPRKGERSVVQRIEGRERELLSRWLQHPDRWCFYRAGEGLYALSRTRFEELQGLSLRLPVVYSGVAMGEIFKGALKPDQALAHAVALNRGVVPEAELPLDEALNYLRKGDVRAEGFAEGLNLVCYKGLPLGFAKRIGGRVNNMYPNALRILNK